MNIRFLNGTNYISSLPTIFRWIAKYQIDATDKLQKITYHATALASLLQKVKVLSDNDRNFNQKFFYTLLDIVEKKSQETAPIVLPPPQTTAPHILQGRTASHTIPLKKLKKYVSVADIRAALALNSAMGKASMLAPIDQTQVADLKILIDSTAEDKFLLNEKQLALLVILVFSPIREFSHQLSGKKQKNKDNISEEFEHEAGDEITQDIINANKTVPLPSVELSIKIFGEERAAALIKLFNEWPKSQIFNIPALTNAILLIPCRFLNIFTNSVIKFGFQYFFYYNLEKELDILYETSFTANEKYLEKLIYILTWPIKHGIHSPSNTEKMMISPDFIEYFPELEIERELTHCMPSPLVEAEETQRNQKILDLIIHHLQTCENLYGIQTQYIFQQLNDPTLAISKLGSDVSNLICEYAGAFDSLETQGFFARKYLRQMPEDKRIEPQDFLTGYKPK